MTPGTCKVGILSVVILLEFQIILWRRRRGCFDQSKCIYRNERYRLKRGISVTHSCHLIATVDVRYNGSGPRTYVGMKIRTQSGVVRPGSSGTIVMAPSNPQQSTCQATVPPISLYSKPDLLTSGRTD